MRSIVGSALPIITGDTLPFFGTQFTVAGTMEPTGMKFFDQSVFMTTEAAYSMAENSRDKSQQPLELEKNKISAVLVQIQDGFTPDRIAIRIEHDVEGVKAIASDEVTSTVRRQLSGLLHGILVISSILWILALLMTGFAFYMIVNERQRELGLLRAMGARKGHVFSLIIAEAVVISLSGGSHRHCGRRLSPVRLQGHHYPESEAALSHASSSCPWRTDNRCCIFRVNYRASRLVTACSLCKQDGTVRRDTKGGIR